MNQHLIAIEDLATGEIEKLLTLASRIKEKPSLTENALRGKTLGLIFQKPSTRTWVSFEVGISQMNGAAIYLGPADIKLNEREDVKDVARVLNRYLDGVIMRTFDHETITKFENYLLRGVNK